MSSHDGEGSKRKRVDTAPGKSERPAPKKKVVPIAPSSRGRGRPSKAVTEMRNAARMTNQPILPLGYFVPPERSVADAESTSDDILLMAELDRVEAELGSRHEVAPAASSSVEGSNKGTSGDAGSGIVAVDGVVAPEGGDDDGGGGAGANIQWVASKSSDASIKSNAQAEDLINNYQSISPWKTTIPSHFEAIKERVQKGLTCGV